MLKAGLRWVSLLYLAGLILVCLGHGASLLQGDPPISPCHPLSELRPAASLTAPTAALSEWQQLQPSLRLLEATCPAVSQWIQAQHQGNRIVFRFDLPFDVPQYAQSTLSYQSPFTGHLLLAPAFWEQPPLAQARILAHEYRHAHQNWGKVLAHRVTQFLTLQAFINPNDTPLETEATAYELVFMQAISGSQPHPEKPY